MPRRLPLSVLATVAVVALAVAVAVIVTSSPGGGSSPSQTSASGGESAFDGAALPGGEIARGFTLSDQHGRSVSLSDYRGHVVVLAFLYSTCGATCIVIAQQIRGALDELPRPVPVLFVTANPAADTPANVARFLSQVSLSGRVEYLTGPASRLRPIWRAYHITPASAGARAFDRFASVLLLDARGEERVLFQSEQLTPESLAHDIGKLGGDPTNP
jgi:protein SCO1